ncbi:MAG TPA: type II secretion system protein [Acidimicrobiales bacterium]|nr:type II secretion system protein [Acidimicrobiales bacterium]
MIASYQRLQKQRREGEISGFTLIELLIVIVVLGILAAVVIFALGGITGKSQLAACQADGATVSTAMSAFVAQNPGTTITTNGLIQTDTRTGGPYIQSWPSATSYKFTLLASGTASGGMVLQVAGLKPANGPINYVGPASCGPAAAGATSIGLH